MPEDHNVEHEHHSGDDSLGAINTNLDWIKKDLVQKSKTIEKLFDELKDMRKEATDCRTHIDGRIDAQDKEIAKNKTDIAVVQTKSGLIATFITIAGSALGYMVNK